MDMIIRQLKKEYRTINNGKLHFRKDKRSPERGRGILLLRPTNQWRKKNDNRFFSCVDHAFL